MSVYCGCEWLGRLVTVHKSSASVSIRKLEQKSQSHSNNYDLQDTFSSQKIPSKFTELLACQSIVDSFSGLRGPNLLIASAPEKDSFLHEILVCNHSGTFEKCGLTFKVQTGDLPETGNEYHLLDGPTVVWCQNTKIHIVHGQDMHQTTVNIEKVTPALKLRKIRNLWCKTKFGLDGLLQVVFLLQLILRGVDYSREFGAREWVCLQVQLPDEDSLFEKEAKTKRIHDVIPSDYGCIANCISTLGEFHTEVRNGADFERTVFLVGTEYKQVVLFESGMLRQVVSLQEVPQKVLGVQGIRAGSMDLVVEYAGGTAVVYELKDMEVEDKGMWNDISACLKGDFAGLGFDQILMLTKEENPSRHFVKKNNILCPDRQWVEDTEDNRDQKGDREVAPIQETPKSLLNVLRALHLKKHTTEAQLTQLESALHHKYSLLARSLGFLESLGKEMPAQELKADPSLVCLFPGSVDIPAENTLEDSSAPLPIKQPPSDVQVLRVWQRVDEGKWIVGLVIKNASKNHLTGVGALVMSSGSCDPLPRESTCRVVWSEEKGLCLSDTSNSPPEKKRRLESLVSALDSSKESKATSLYDFELVEPGASFCLVLVTGSGIPGSEGVVIGMWRKEGNEEVQTEELARVKLTAKLMCSRELGVDMNCLGLWNGSPRLSSKSKFHTKEAQDLAGLLASNSLIQVSVSTSFTELFRLPSMIRARLPLPPHALQLGSSCSVASAAATLDTAGAGSCGGPGGRGLEGIALHISLQSSESAVLSILYKCHSDLCVVLKLLKELLPGDLEYHLVGETDASQHQTLQQVLGRVREEAEKKAESLERVLTTTRVEGVARGSEDDTVELPASLCEHRVETATDVTLSLLQDWK